MNRLIKLFALVACLAALTTKANAAGEAMFSKGHSTWTVSGVNCTSAAVDISGSLPGFKISGYRITNHETSIAVYLGHNANVSATSSSANLGEKLTAGSNGVWEIGNNPDLAQIAVKIWCIAASSTARLSVAIFGYK